MVRPGDASAVSLIFFLSPFLAKKKKECGDEVPNFTQGKLCDY